MRLLYRVALLLMATVSTKDASACDMCGGSNSIQGLGLLTQFSGHFAGLQVLHNTASSRHPSLFEGRPDEESAQAYTTVQARGRYQLSKSIQLAGFLSYISNQNRDPLLSKQSGIGDAVLMANFSVPLERKNKNELLLLGGGVKLPSGKYTAATTGLSPTLQTGTGSWDFIGNCNYTRKYTRWGYNADLSYLLTTANRDQYKFGNRLSASGLLFYQANARAFRIIPQAGLRAEYSLHDYDDYRKKWLNEQSGGTIAFASAGIQVYFKKIGVSSTVYLPFYQRLSGGYVQSDRRAEAGIFILF